MQHHAEHRGQSVVHLPKSRETRDFEDRGYEVNCSNAYYALKVAQRETFVHIPDELLPGIVAHCILDISGLVRPQFGQPKDFVQRLALTKEILRSVELDFIHEFLQNVQESYQARNHRATMIRRMFANLDEVQVGERFDESSVSVRLEAR